MQKPAAPKFYIVSLKHTYPTDLLFTFWRANGAGYAFQADRFGKYGLSEGSILASQGIIPAGKLVPVETVERFFTPTLDDAGKLFKTVPISAATLAAFGIQRDQLHARHPYDWYGMEFCIDPHSGQVGQINTKHSLEFFVAKDPEKSGWQYFKVGTITGKYRFMNDAIEISRIDNENPGNGHLDDMFEHFEHAVKDTPRVLRILNITNERFEQHLIGKRDFRTILHEGKLALMKRVGHTFKIASVTYLSAEAAAELRERDRPTFNPL